MAATTALRGPRVNLVHGGRAAAVAVIAEVTGTAAGSDAITVALISVAGGFLVMLAQILITDWLRNRRDRRRTFHPDHSEEQAELNQLLIDEMHWLKAENERLRRRKP